VGTLIELIVFGFGVLEDESGVGVGSVEDSLVFFGHSFENELGAFIGCSGVEGVHDFVVVVDRADMLSKHPSCLSN